MTRGIVLTNGTPTQGMVFHMALVFEKNYKYVRDFKLMPVVTTRMMKKIVPSDQFEERGPIEKTKLVEDTLLFGDNLEWDDLDHNGMPVEVVRSYNKVADIYESRMFDGETQILLQGIMSRNRKVLWMLDVWPDLEIPFELRQNAHPNVALDVWVILQIQPDQSLKYEFHSFKQAADSCQHLVKMAKWNEGDEGNLTEFYDPIAKNAPNPEYLPPISDSLTGMQGIVISPKIVVPLDPRHRDICFHRIVFRQNDRFPPVGSFVRFDAEKMDFLNIYALKDVMELTDGRKLPTDQGLVKLTIRADPELPGFYFSEAIKCYVDDPENRLEGWLMSTYVKSTLQVLITASEPSQCGVPRFAIADVTDQKVSKVAKQRASGDLRLVDEEAIVTDFDGKLHVRRLPKSHFRLPVGHSYPPGTIVNISAKLEKRWKIEKVAVNRKKPFIESVNTIDARTQLPVIMFRVPIVRGCKELPFLLNCPLFGLIDTPRTYKIHRRPESFVYTDIWISLNDCHPGDMLRPPAKFKFCGIGDVRDFAQPIEPVQLEQDSPDTSIDISSDKDDEADKENITPRNYDARNESNIPAVYPSISVKFQKIPEMLQKLKSNPLWRSKPVKLIESEVTEHLAHCQSCAQRQFNEHCSFPEYLSHALSLKPQIAELFTTDLLALVALRRFER